MPHEKMPQQKSLGPRSVLGLCSPLLLLAEIEAEGKAKKARLRAQQVRVAKGKKGRFRAALRYLWERESEGGINWIEFCRSLLRPHSRSKVRRTAQPGRPERKGKPSGAVRQMPPEEKKGRE